MTQAMADALGFALLAAAAAAALLCLIVWRSRGRSRGLWLGGSLLVLFLLTRLMLERLLPALVAAPPAVRAVLGQGLATLAALAGAFTLDAALRRFLWYGTLRDGDHSKAPNILIGLASLALFLLTLLFIAAEVFGLDVTAVAATSGVVAIVLGVSAQQTLGQVFAGLALNLSRPFRIGDSVQMDGVWGVVVDANWRGVTLRTYEGTHVTLPNLLVAASRLTNLDAPHHDLRQKIHFVADPDTPPGRVQAVALAAMAGVPHVLAQPAPLVLFTEFEDRGVGYDAFFWHRDPNVYILRRDEVGHALWYAFRREGIAIAVNRRLLAAPEGAARPPAPEETAAEQARLLAILRRNRLFAQFPEPDLQALATRTRRRLFAAGERIMRQDEQGSSLFVILEGQVSVRLEDAEGGEAEIYTQGPGEVFGHMSALTGAARFATVRAAGHLVLEEMDKATLAPLIAAHPELVEQVARETLRIDAGHAALRQARDRDGAAMGEAEHAGLLDRLAERIRKFFGDFG